MAGDWIDKLKAREQSDPERARQADLRLEDARIIRAKAPDFWRVVKMRVEHDCRKLKAQFPGRAEYECEFAELPDVNGFVLTHGLRRITAVLFLDGLCVGLFLDGLCVGLTEYVKDDPLSPEQMAMREIAIQAEPNNGLLFMAGRTPYRTPEALAEYFIRSVLHV